MSRQVLILSLLMLSLSLLVGCQAAQPAGPAVVQVRLTEFSYTPNTIRLLAGKQVQIEFLNEGAIEHEFFIGRDVKMEEGKAAGYQEDFFAKGALQVQTSGEEFKIGSPEEIEEEGWHVEVEPGGKAILAFTVPPESKGDWEIGCFTPGHYEAGMKGTLIIQ